MGLPLLIALLLSLGLTKVHAQAVPANDGVPASNRADLAQVPPRPPVESAQAHAKLLFDAIVHDEPARAAEFFFPRDAFLLVKAMQKPERYWDKLRARFDQDIHALHHNTPDLDKAEFERLELTRRGGWVKPGEEGNHLPYWAARHAWLHYRVGKQKRKLEVRVLITWDDRWYVIHLSEFSH
ncbi:MAG: hypothetical protein QM778_35490 [Myxococcales bacterium]